MIKSNAPVAIGSALALAIVASLSLGIPHAHASHADNLPWSDCSIEGNANYATGNSWRYRIQDDLPDDKTVEGASWSFTDRISDAASEWTTELDNQSPQFYLREAGSSESAQVELYYGDFGSQYATTTTISDSGNCYYTDVQNFNGDWERVLSSDIELEQRSDWFTAWNYTRNFWENNCPHPDYPYTCSKDIDFGGVIVHEFGHTLMFAHPESIDIRFHDYDPQAQHWLNCRSVEPNSTDAASMCPNTGDEQVDEHHSDRRTLTTFDRNTVDRHWDRNP